jgi:ferrochelatase
MRYWHPLTEEAVRAVEAYSPDELVLLPLYPQYSRTTTGSSLNEWNRQIGSSPLKQLPTRIIRDFYSDAAYLDALAANINKSQAKFPADEEVHLVSAHTASRQASGGDPTRCRLKAP